MNPTVACAPIPLTGGRRVAVLATGGTIAGLASSGAGHGSYKAAELSVQDLLASLPAGFGARPAHVVAEQVAQIDSKDMNAQVWDALAARCAHYLADAQTDGIVITHGTDTLEETAWFLQRVLPPAGKPVVLVSAMRPADSPEADGPGNLADGLGLAQVRERLLGVLVAHAGHVHQACYVQKVHPSRLDAFASVGGEPLGSVRNGELHLSAPASAGSDEQEAARAVRLSQGYWHHKGRPWPKVAVLTSHAGVQADIVPALVQAGYAGVVVQATGNGTVHEALQESLQVAQRQGLAVWLTTRCPQGSISAHEETLSFRASPLPALKARIELVLELMG